MPLCSVCDVFSSSSQEYGDVVLEIRGAAQVLNRVSLAACSLLTVDAWSDRLSLRRVVSLHGCLFLSASPHSSVHKCTTRYSYCSIIMSFIAFLLLFGFKKYKLCEIMRRHALYVLLTSLLYLFL
jgi:hypothetical protein